MRESEALTIALLLKIEVQQRVQREHEEQMRRIRAEVEREYDAWWARQPRNPDGTITLMFMA